jgi:iron(III) transport system ATP-binding protein
MIRSDDVAFVPDDAGSGVITRRYFRGSETLYCIRLLSGQRVHSAQPSSATFTTGMRVRATAQVLHVVAFPRDDRAP